MGWKSRFLRKRFVLLIAAVVFLATLSAVALMQARASTQRQGENVPSPPPPPSPGPPPTYVPEVLAGEAVETAEMAIQVGLEIDSDWASREQPISREILAAEPGMLVVEHYATRQEADDIYLGGVSGSGESDSGPMWVVRIKGQVLVRVIGGIGRLQADGSGWSGFEEADGVTYIISQRTGQLLSIISSSPRPAGRQRQSSE